MPAVQERDVEPAELAHGECDSLSRVRSLGHVAAHEHAADLIGDGFALVGVHISHDDVYAERRQTPGGRGADAVGSAGDERDLAGEFHGHLPPRIATFRPVGMVVRTDLDVKRTDRYVTKRLLSSPSPHRRRTRGRQGCDRHRRGSWHRCRGRAASRRGRPSRRVARPRRAGRAGRRRQDRRERRARHRPQGRRRRRGAGQRRRREGRRGARRADRADQQHAACCATTCCSR